MNRDILQKQLSEKIVEQRMVKAARAFGKSEAVRDWASYWCRVHTDEARQWELAAERAKAGDLTPYVFLPPPPSDVTFNGVSYEAKEQIQGDANA
jgi:hypothetical protein